MKWENKKFIDFIQLQRGHDLTKEQFEDGPYPVVSSTSIMGYHKEYRAEGPGVVIGRSGTLGKAQYINDNYWPHNTALYVKDYKGNYPRFVYYFLTDFATDRHGGGSAVPTLNRNNLSAINIKVPEVSTQRRIADILCAYDDLIENNQKQIKLLEEAAMRLYKEWFVHLRFPGHETTKIVNGVPEGWTSGKLRDYIEVNPKSISKQYPNENIQYIDISSVNSGRIEQRTGYKLSEAPGRAKRIACDGDTVWGMVRPNLKAYALVISPEDCDVFSTGFAVLSPIKLPYTFLYCMVTQEAFVSYLVNSTNGTAYPAVKPIHFEEAKVVVPSESLLRKFHDFANPLFRSIHWLNEQSKLLKQARDILLPKLMIGEIEI